MQMEPLFDALRQIFPKTPLKYAL